MTESEFRTHCDDVQRDAHTVVPRMLTPDECDTATRELDHLAKSRGRGGLECVFNKTPLFERAYQI